ncbi:type II toxin-antitoxin system RelE/ParE family toxin [Mycolicibacterium obuense]|nr:type II toxin-antitoxin system RelE/ParE family toxin [Mycolicibacterium obuense]
MELKPVAWLGTTHDDIRAERKAIQDRLGHQLLRVQLGLMPDHYRPMPDVGRGTYEIRVKDDDGISRLMYVAKFGNKINVLHVFTKKTQKTPKPDIDLAKKRYKEAKENG